MMPEKDDTGSAGAVPDSEVRRPGPQAMELLISKMLAIGLIVSSLVVTIGGVFLLAQHGGDILDVRSFHSERISLSSVGGVFSAALALRPKAIVQLGLLLLVATPVTRVGLSVLLFLQKKDYLYVGITSVVLVILLLAISDEH